MTRVIKKRVLSNLQDVSHRNDLTELIFILDRSGSMSGLESDTIGGFNSMITEQKEKDGRCLVSTILFNDRSKVVHDRVNLSEIRDMTRDDYRVSGCTALIDALGDAIHHIANIHKYARSEDVPAHTMFVITTDGLENASHRYSADEVRKMITREKEKHGWEFIFIGANIDAVETARRYGIDEEMAVDYCSDSAGTSAVFASVSCAVREARAYGAPTKSWKKSIEQDNLRRSNK